jgi:hypothetical protein
MKFKILKFHFQLNEVVLNLVRSVVSGFIHRMRAVRLFCIEGTVFSFYIPEYICETWPVTVREEYRLRVFDNNVWT